MAGDAGIKWKGRPTITGLLARIRDEHPAFADRGKSRVLVLRGINLILDGLTVARDNESLAHPREVLEEHEAELLINASHSAWRYIDAVLDELADEP